MEGTIKSEIKNGIGTITFFHPQSNSMPGVQLRNLAAEIEKLGKDAQQHGGRMETAIKKLSSGD